MVRIGGTFYPWCTSSALLGRKAISRREEQGSATNAGVGKRSRGPSSAVPGGRGATNNNNRAWVANLYLAAHEALWTADGSLRVSRTKITLPVVNPAGNEFREWIFRRTHCSGTKEDSGIPGGIRKCQSQEYFDQCHHQQSGLLRARIAYRLPWLERNAEAILSLRAYAHGPLSEQLFTNQDLVQSIVGMRYDITNYASFQGRVPQFQAIADGSSRERRVLSRRTSRFDEPEI